MNAPTLIDETLEALVVPSFSRIGFAVRRRLFDWQPFPARALAGRTVVVTGPTSGIGRVAATALAALGARVVLVGRNAERLARVRDALVAEHDEDRFPLVIADMASLASIGAATEQIRRTEARVDVIVDNAGAVFAERTESPDGIEETLATMVTGPFAFVSDLLPMLRASAPSRVIAVTSGGMYAAGLHLDDLQWRAERFDGTRAYARAKRAQVVLIREWARRVPPSAVTFAAMHPGWADTPGLAASLPGFARVMRPILRTPAEGADTIVWLAAVPPFEVGSGRLYLDRRPRPFDRVPGTRVAVADRRCLWDAVVAMSDRPDPAPDRSGWPRDRDDAPSQPAHQVHRRNP